MRRVEWVGLLVILTFAVGMVVLTVRTPALPETEAPVSSPAPTRTRVAAPVDPRETAGQRPSKEIRSPGFNTDGIAFRLTDSRLYRQALGGLTWTAVSFPDDQLVGQVAFAPVPGTDRPIFATVTSNGFPPLTMDRRPRPTDDHARSVGVMVSRDGGINWHPTAGQPEIDGIPYRHVQEIVVSPTFAQDQTIVAFAWGPSEPAMRGPSGVLVRPMALFLSGDAGASWSPIWKPSDNPPGGLPTDSMYAEPLSTHVALSRSFAQDHRLILNMEGGRSPAGGLCFVLNSANGGQSWGQLASGRGYDAFGSCIGYPGGMVVPSRGAQPQTSTIPPARDLFVDSEGNWRPLPPPPTREPTLPWNQPFRR